jgi:hypothetical protein
MTVRQSTISQTKPRDVGKFDISHIQAAFGVKFMA